MAGVSILKRRREIHRVLRRGYGRPSPVKRDPLDELILTILSQNTSDINSRDAFERLRASFPSWRDVESAPVSVIARVIRRCGLANIKARRIKNALGEIRKRWGRLSLKPLARLEDIEAYRYLTSMKGVGPKTASIVLLFSFGRPFMPVDTHVFRVSKRLGLIGERTNIEDAHRDLTSMTPSSAMPEFHLNLINHGRAVCTARNPKCAGCVLKKLCAWGRS